MIDKKEQERLQKNEQQRKRYAEDLEYRENCLAANLLSRGPSYHEWAAGPNW